MTRSDLLKKMFQSYRNGDHTGFSAAAQQVIDDERKKNHVILANELERLLSNGAVARPLHSGNLRPLPKAREDAPLLRLEEPSRSFQELVLKPETRKNLLQVVSEFRSGSVLHAHAMRPRSHLLFVGPPGCGKSVTAEAIAMELGLPLAKVHLATVVSSYLGETSRNLEAIFRFCEQGSWVLLFDEFDALAKERSDRAEHGELKRVVTAFLQLLDGFHGPSMVIATTNHPALLDEAVWRRFDEVVAFPLPTEEEIEKVLEIKLRSVRIRFAKNGVAHRLKGLSHADIEAVCHDALRQAILDGRNTVELQQMMRGLSRMKNRWKTIRSFRG